MFSLPQELLEEVDLTRSFLVATVNFDEATADVLSRVATSTRPMSMWVYVDSKRRPITKIYDLSPLPHPFFT
jgi:hypothetical protein